MAEWRGDKTVLAANRALAAEATVAQILTTEESAARDEANLSAVREWLHNAYLNT